MPQLEVDGAALTYDDEGPRDGDGVPLVFIHGWTANRHRWDHQIDHFAQKRRVVRLDLRGHGESAGSGRRTVAELAGDVLAVLDHLEIDRFVLVGHSMGGMIAQTLTLDHPDRVERLVLVNSISRMTYSRGRGLLMAVSTLVPFKLFVAANIQRAFAPGYPREKIREHVRASADTPREVVMTCYGAMRSFDVLDRLGEIRTPPSWSTASTTSNCPSRRCSGWRRPTRTPWCGSWTPATNCRWRSRRNSPPCSTGS